jgi:hypothetical protein
VHEESACRTRHVSIAARPYTRENLFPASFSLALSIVIAEHSMLQSSCSLPARLHTELEPKFVAQHDTEDQLLSRELLLNLENHQAANLFNEEVCCLMVLYRPSPDLRI